MVIWYWNNVEYDIQYEYLDKRKKQIFRAFNYFRYKRQYVLQHFNLLA